MQIYEKKSLRFNHANVLKEKQLVFKWKCVARFSYDFISNHYAYEKGM